MRNNLDILIKKLKNKTPISLRKNIKNIFKLYRKNRNIFYKKYLKRALSKEDIYFGLKNIGIDEGDAVMVHSSISRLGIVDGGADTILEALFEAVGPYGTVGAPTFWGLKKDYLAGSTLYDVKRSKSYLGALTETIRTHAHSKRSLHPTHSAAFIGPMADFLIKNHHYDKTPFGPNSPYRKLIDLNGKILLLGVGIEYMSSLHTIEDFINNFSIKVYRDQPLKFRVIDDNDNDCFISSYIHCSNAAKTRNSLKLLPIFEKEKIIRKSKIGFGSVKLINASELHTIMLKLYKSGITMYG